MSEVVVVQQIFCPTKDMFDFNVNSITSLAKYFEANNYKDIDFVFGGYAEPEYLQRILTLYKKYFSGRCKFFKFEDNFGKAYVVNHLVNQYLTAHPETKYILTFDSDIVFETYPENAHLIDRLTNLVPYVETLHKRPFGLFGINMHGDNAHWLHKFDRRHTIGDEVVSWPSNGVGIAGGALFISVDLWKKIHGYQVVGVYAPDDAILMRDTVNAGHSISVVETTFINHPGTQDDKEYQSWKVKTSQIRMTYENAIKYNNEFWKARREREVKEYAQTVSYIILYKEEFKERKDNLIMLLEMLENYFGSDLEIQIIEQDTQSRLQLPFNRPNIKQTFLFNEKPFNRSWAFNVAALKTNKPILAFADTDIIMKKKEFVHAFAEAQNYSVVNPFKNGMHDIVDMSIVNRFRQNKAVTDDMVGVNARGVGPTAGLVLFNRETFLAIGGWDEGFEGWGAEDDALSFKVKQTGVSIIELTYNCLHLPHPRHGPHDNPNYKNNCELLGRIASMNSKQLDEYILEQVNVIGREDKYK